MPAPGPSPALPSARDTASDPERPGFKRVEVFYGTDRRPVEGADPKESPAEYYGSERGELRYGTLVVSIPERHEAGVIERPSCNGEDPSRHISLVRLTPLDDEAWFDRLGGSLAGAGKDEVLVYIHGYKTSFERAVHKAGQLAYDLSFAGVPVAYSWPSEGSFGAYMKDAETAVLSAPKLASFLGQLLESVGRGKVHVLAYSLGNRVLSGALRSLTAERSDGQRLLGQVILAAPDVNADIFRELIAPEIRGIAERITLYASSKDRMLDLAQKANGYWRAGQAGDSIVVVEGIDTVDASRMETDLLGHGYFSENKRVVDDLFLLIRHRLPPEERNLRTVSREDRGYWLIP